MSMSSPLSVPTLPLMMRGESGKGGDERDPALREDPRAEPVFATVIAAASPLTLSSSLTISKRAVEAASTLL